MDLTVNNIGHICFILDGYPYGDNNTCSFARNLIVEIASRGIRCTVITPQICNKRNRSNVPYYRKDITREGKEIEIFSPPYVHFTSKKCMMGLSMNSHYHAALRTMKNENINPDCVYGHFIYQCGLTAARIGNRLGIKAFCAIGENSTRLEKNSMPYSNGRQYYHWKSILNGLDGIIAVSDYNLRLAVDNDYITSAVPSVVLPNGVNHNIFHPNDKRRARNELGLPQDAFIVVFTGSFSDRKGVRELSDALDTIDDVYSIFIGDGDIAPSCHNILFSGSVPNDSLSTYLNASDVFVLPTKGEGCSNAILEAMACGLPIVSSNLPFNDNLLDETNSIRISPTDANQIRQAILELKNNNTSRRAMAISSEQKSKAFDITKRADNILSFMERVPNNGNKE